MYTQWCTFPRNKMSPMTLRQQGIITPYTLYIYAYQFREVRREAVHTISDDRCVAKPRSSARRVNIQKTLLAVFQRHHRHHQVLSISILFPTPALT